MDLNTGVNGYVSLLSTCDLIDQNTSKYQM